MFVINHACCIRIPAKVCNFALIVAEASFASLQVRGADALVGPEVVDFAVHSDTAVLVVEARGVCFLAFASPDVLVAHS